MSAVYLLRHGQASFGAEDYDHLSDRGVEQARALGLALKRRAPRPDVVIVGTQRRHRQTADACLAAMEIAPDVAVNGAFDEYDHEEVLVRHEPRYADRATLVADLASSDEPRRAFDAIFRRATARWTSGAHDADYAEPWGAFRARCQRGLDDVTRALGKSRTAFVFTSGGPISVIAAGLLAIPPERAPELQWRLVNAGVSKVLVGRDGATLASLNEHAHLESDDARLVTYR